MSDGDYLPRAYISFDFEWGWLAALEFGRVDDGQPADHWAPVNDHFAYLHDGVADVTDAIGFKLTSLNVDLGSEGFAPIWEAPAFDVPQLGLHAATAGEIILASRRFYGERSSLNRHLFHAAVEKEGEAAVHTWTACLHTGDPIAHFALGYSLYELERYHEAYRHLRYYADLAPAQPWVHCWLGKAAQARGELDEARDAYRRAIDLTVEGGEETDADELLDALEDELGESGCDGCGSAGSAAGPGEPADEGDDLDAAELTEALARLYALVDSLTEDEHFLVEGAGPEDTATNSWHEWAALDLAARRLLTHRRQLTAEQLELVDAVRCLRIDPDHLEPDEVIEDTHFFRVSRPCHAWERVAAAAEELGVRWWDGVSGLPKGDLRFDGEVVLRRAEADELIALLGADERLPRAFGALEVGQDLCPEDAHHLFHRDLRRQLAAAARKDPELDVNRGAELLDRAIGRLLQICPDVLEDVLGPHADVAEYVELVELLKRVGFRDESASESLERE